MGEKITDNLPDAAPVTEELQEAGEAVGEAVENSEVEGLELLQDESGS